MSQLRKHVVRFGEMCLRPHPHPHPPGDSVLNEVVESAFCLYVKQDRQDEFAQMLLVHGGELFFF